MSCKKNIDLAKIYEELLVSYKSIYSHIEGAPSNLCTNSAEISNSFNSITNEKMFLNSFQKMKSFFPYWRTQMPEEINVTNGIQGYFCSNTVFNLINEVLSKTETNVHEKGLDFAPIQNKINGQDFEELCMRMRIKWHYHYDFTPQFSEIPAFTPKSKWQPPKSQPKFEVFFSQIEQELFELTETPLDYSNFSKEEEQSMMSLAYQYSYQKS